MTTNNRIIRSYALISVAAMAACITLSVPAKAKDHFVDVSFKVETGDLNLDEPADAVRLYGRLRHAATIVCGHGMRVDLRPLASPAACLENVIGGAVRSFNRPQLTEVYLSTHSIEEAATHGIEAGRLAAAK